MFPYLKALTLARNNRCSMNISTTGVGIINLMNQGLINFVCDLYVTGKCIENHFR